MIRSLSSLPIGLLLCGLCSITSAQQRPSAPVLYTPAVAHSFESEVRLSGTVQSSLRSTVAGEVEGLVEEFAVREGDAVEKGQLLVRLRATQLNIEKLSVEAELQETLARESLAQRELDRAQELFEAQLIAREQLDAKLYDHTAWKGRDERLRANIARIQDEIDRTEVYAPFDGVVLEERTQLGEWLGKGDPIVVLMSTAGLEVRVEVPERYIRRFRKGSRVGIAFASLDNRRVLGTVRAIIPQADVESRTFPVIVSFANPGGAAPGMMAEAVFSGGNQASQTIIPKDAVVIQGGRQTVFVITSEGTVRPVPVKSGVGVGQWIVVEGPIGPGDRVVTRGNERLSPGQPVNAEPLEYPLP
jgi:RND family efflux transporter MFP subunit